MIVIDIGTVSCFIRLGFETDGIIAIKHNCRVLSRSDSKYKFECGDVIKLILLRHLDS